MAGRIFDFEEKMRLAQAGDKKAYEDVLRELFPLIKNFIKKFNFKNLIDIDDLAQEILLAIHLSSHTYNSSRPFKPWVYAISNYKIKDYLRKIYRTKKLSEVEFSKVENILSSPQEQGVGDDISLSEMLKVLNPKQQKIIKLLKIDGNSLQEAANIMGMSVGAVKTASHRAYKILIKKFSKYE